MLNQLMLVSDPSVVWGLLNRKCAGSKFFLTTWTVFVELRSTENSMYRLMSHSEKDFSC